MRKVWIQVVFPEMHMDHFGQLFEITDERVPCIRVDMGVDDWTAVGRIS